MKTYQDLLSVGENEINKGSFCRQAIDDFMASKDYRIAKDGENYYAKHNTTIEQFQKYLYTVSGRRVKDIFSADYRLKTLFFRRLVTQQVQYVLGNGLTLTNPANKDKLGKDFDFKLQTTAKKAMVGGRAFGFWNYDHLEVFGYADTPNDAGFVPLYSEETAELMAGVRYWFKRVGDKKLLRFTLYEKDGYTDYSQLDDGAVEVVESRRGYKRVVKTSVAGGIEDSYEENYTDLPIVPLYANDIKESELVGIKERIDCYDFIESGLANAIDDTADFYWILKNTGGMDEGDLAKFVQRMKTVKATYIDGDEGVDAEPHTLEIPVNARQTLLELLRKDIYEDFQSLDVNTLSASAKTTQEIQASYQAQDNKCADFEYYILDFVQKILALAGIDDTPSFVWNRVVNQSEQTTMILQASQFLTDEAIIKHLPFLTPEEADEIINSRESEDYNQFNAEDEEYEEDEEIGLGDDEDDDLDIEEILKELEG